MNKSVTVGIDSYHLKMVRLLSSVADRSVPDVLRELIDYAYAPICDKYAKKEDYSKEASEHASLLLTAVAKDVSNANQ